MCEKFSNLHNKHSAGSKKAEPRNRQRRREREQEATIVNSFNPKFSLIKQLFYPQHIFSVVALVLREFTFLHSFFRFTRGFFVEDV